MSRRHITDDQLLDRLYGMERTGDAQHLKLCPDCAERWELLQERREQVMEDAPEPAMPWAEQRRQVLDRLKGSVEAPRRALRWAPVWMTAVVLAAAIWFYHPARVPPPGPAPVAVDTVDDNWFEDAYSGTQPDEPRAATPIRVLFEQGEERATE